MGSHSVTCHLAKVWVPPIPPAEAGTRFSDPRWMQGWVDLCYVIVDRLGFKPTTCQSQVERPTACVYHCAQLSYAIQHRTILIIFPLILQTVSHYCLLRCCLLARKIISLLYIIRLEVASPAQARRWRHAAYGLIIAPW